MAGPRKTRPKVGEILMRAGLIDEMQLRAALGDQSNWGHRLGVTLVKMGVLEERDLVRALAQQLQLPVVQLEGKRVQPEVLDLVPQEFAEKHMCIPLFLKEHAGLRILHVGMEDPSNLAAIDELGFRTGLEVQPVLVSPSELCEAIDRFYHRKDGDSQAYVRAPGSPIDLEDGKGRQRTGVVHVPDVEESLFPEVSETSASETAAPERERAPAAGDASTKAILRALCQLLIEKNVVTREELESRIRFLTDDPVG